MFRIDGLIAHRCDGGVKPIINCRWAKQRKASKTTQKNKQNSCAYTRYTRPRCLADCTLPETRKNHEKRRNFKRIFCANGAKAQIDHDELAIQHSLGQITATFSENHEPKQRKIAQKEHATLFQRFCVDFALFSADYS